MLFKTTECIKKSKVWALESMMSQVHVRVFVSFNTSSNIERYCSQNFLSSTSYGNEGWTRRNLTKKPSSFSESQAKTLNIQHFCICSFKAEKHLQNKPFTLGSNKNPQNNQSKPPKPPKRCISSLAVIANQKNFYGILLQLWVFFFFFLEKSESWNSFSMWWSLARDGDIFHCYFWVLYSRAALTP